MKDNFSKTLYVIKWYNGESQMRVLRKVTDEDFEKMEVIL